jgi:hypothetical protein
MRAGILGTVNFLPERFGEAQAHVGGRKNGGDLVYGLGAISIAVVHERSPWRPPTTMSASRSSAVWWDYRRGLFPRPFTIYAGNVEDVSLGGGDFARALTNAERRNQRRGDGAQRGSGTGQDSAGQPSWARTERRTETGSSSKDYADAQGRCRQPTGTQISGGKGFGSSGRTRTSYPLVHSGEITPLFSVSRSCSVVVCNPVRPYSGLV